MSYLRLTPDEFRAVARACRTAPLTDEFFPSFRHYLTQALVGTGPELIGRLSRLRKHELRLLYDHLRQRRDGPERDRPIEEKASGGLTGTEFGRLLRACRASVPHPRFLIPFRQVLVYQLRADAPELAAKLARLSDRQFGRLYEFVRRLASS